MPRMRSGRHGLIWRLFVAGWLGMSAGAMAADTPGPSLTWQVSPDRRSLAVGWHDPTGIRAVVESSHDLRHWYHDEGIYQPGKTSYVFHPVGPALGRHWGAPLGASGQFYRLRRLPVLREGRVSLGNRIIASGVNAPVTFLGDPRPGSPLGGSFLADGRFLGQFIVEVRGVFRVAFGEPVRFRSGTLAGSIPAAVVAVPMAKGTDEVMVTMVAWAAEMGATYYEAKFRCGPIGESLPVTVRPAINDSDLPPVLVGLSPFMISGPLNGCPP